ncbi:MAG TPA: DUF11 domain-containing protein [Actinomycetota bacterium]|jgi:uncharacterized repeat protein (TIGR01451 family)|nr:DUF11 domain-containing protein [Actinomycetota bacterium]
MASRKFWSGRVLIGTVAAIVLVAVTSVPSMVSAAPAKKYALTVSPTTATVGQATIVTVTMTNETPPGTNSNPSSFYVTVPFPISGGIDLPETDAEALAGSTNANLSATVDIDPSNPSRILVRSLDAVKKAQFVKLTFTVTPASCTPSDYLWVTNNFNLVKVTNGAALNGDTFAPTDGSLNTKTTVSCGPPALSVSKTADASGVAAGSPAGFTITATNSGGAPATGVTLIDVLPTDAGLSWGIDGGTGAGFCSITNGTLSCNFGNMAANTSLTVHISSPTTPDTVADSPVQNTASISATNVTPDPASAAASVTVFTDAITCEDNGEGGVTQGGEGTPLTTLERFNNADDPEGDDCVPIPFNQDSDNGEEICATGTFATQCILLEKDLLGQVQAQFLWTVEWTPEAGEYPAHPTQFDFGTGVFRNLQRCEEDGPDVEGPGEPVLPELPLTADPNDGDALDPWCIVNSSSELDLVTGEMKVKELYYGKGDPTGRR